jgi:hypothetical protein
MKMSHVRIRLKSGEREVEVDAPSDVAEKLAAKWWGLITVEDNASHARHDRSAGAHVVSRKQHDADPKDNVPDAVEVANAIKEHSDYAMIQARVLHAGSRWRKVALILWACNRFLTSGDIHRILRELGDKIDQPGVSNLLRDNQAELQASGSRGKGKTVAYRLTSRAHKDFSDWLKSGEGSKVG